MVDICFSFFPGPIYSTRSLKNVVNKKNNSSCNPNTKGQPDGSHQSPLPVHTEAQSLKKCCLYVCTFYSTRAFLNIGCFTETDSPTI